MPLEHVYLQVSDMSEEICMRIYSKGDLNRSR